MLGVPLVAHGRTVGVIGLCHMSEDRTFTNDDEVLVSRFAQLASLALERAELTAALTQSSPSADEPRRSSSTPSRG